MIPARNSAVIGTSAYQAKMTNAMLGGISASIVPEAATTPVASALSYLYFSISGIASRAIVAVTATLDPETAPNAALAQFVATANPPGTHQNHMRHAR